jgi:hypothetical protein
MECSHTIAGQVQLDDYVDIAHEIYAKNDAYRSIWDVWAHTLHHAAGIAESIRKSAPPAKLFNEIADCTLWLLTAIHKFSGLIAEPKAPDIEPPETLVRIQSGCSDLLWHRYPAVCHTCYLRRTEGNREKENDSTFIPCDCSAHPDTVGYSKEVKRRALDALRRLSDDRRDQKPKSIDQWQEMFGRVFSSNISRLSLTDLALHLMEELGEASDAMIRMYSYKKDDFVPAEPIQRQFRLEAQLADAFSQLFAIVEKINQIATQCCEFSRVLSKGSAPVLQPIRLSAILWDRYGCDDLKSFWCPFCKKISCKCELVFVPATRPVKEFLQLLKQ